jgi:hypothetical protein
LLRLDPGLPPFQSEVGVRPLSEELDPRLAEHRRRSRGSDDLAVELVGEQHPVVREGSRMYLEAGEPNEGEPRSPSAVIGIRVLVQPVEELLGCPFGPERVKDRVLPVLRDDLLFALGL